MIFMTQEKHHASRSGGNRIYIGTLHTDRQGPADVYAIGYPAPLPDSYMAVFSNEGSDYSSMLGMWIPKQTDSWAEDFLAAMWTFGLLEPNPDGYGRWTQAAMNFACRPRGPIRTPVAPTCRMM